MEEKIKYIFIGFIGTTIIYLMLLFGVIFVASDKEDIEIKPVSEVGPFICEEFNDIKHTFNNDLIINNGYLYITNMNMIYSNEQNCKKMSDINISKVIDNYFIAPDKTIYTYDSTSNSLKVYQSNGRVPAYLLEDNIVMATNYENDSYKYYVLKNDGKIYNVIFDRKFDFGSASYYYITTSEEVLISYEDEVIKSFNTTIDKIDFVVTDKGIYTNKITNPECNNYADVDCIYELVKNETLEEKMENIKYIDKYENTIFYINSEDKVFKFDIVEG